MRQSGRHSKSMLFKQLEPATLTEALPVRRYSPFPPSWSDVSRRHIVNFSAYKFGTNFTFPSFCLAPFRSILRLAHIRTRDSETCWVSFTYSIDATPTRVSVGAVLRALKCSDPEDEFRQSTSSKGAFQLTSVLSDAKLEFAGRFAGSSGYRGEVGQKTRQSEGKHFRAKF